MCFTRVCVPVILFRVCKSSWHTCELYTRVGFQRCAGNGACVLKKRKTNNNSRPRRYYLAGCFWGKHFRDIRAGYFCSLARPAMVSWYQPIRFSELYVCLFFVIVFFFFFFSYFFFFFFFWGGLLLLFVCVFVVFINLSSIVLSSCSVDWMANLSSSKCLIYNIEKLLLQSLSRLIFTRTNCRNTLSASCTANGAWSREVTHSDHSFSTPSSKLCQNWLRHWRSTLYFGAAVHRRCQRPPKSSEY